MRCFEDVDAVIFAASLTGLSSVLYEDEKAIRLNESLEVFESVVSRHFFKVTPVFVWLTKVDLFHEVVRN